MKILEIIYEGININNAKIAQTKKVYEDLRKTISSSIYHIEQESDKLREFIAAIQGLAEDDNYNLVMELNFYI